APPPAAGAAATPESGAGSGGTEAAANKHRGFLIMVRCTTPNADGPTYINKTFVTNLLNLSKVTVGPSGKPLAYRIEKAYIPFMPMKVGDDEQKRTTWEQNKMRNQTGG